MLDVNYIDVFDRVNSELRKKRIKKEFLASVCGCSDSSISAWANGTRTPSCTYMARIADYLDVSLEWLLFGKEKETDGDLSTEERELVDAYRHLSSQSKIVILFAAKGLRQG